MVGNSGRYSKFQQRLRNIYLSWFFKKKNKKVNQNELFADKVSEINKGIGYTKINVSRRVGISDKRVISVKDSKKFDKKVTSKVKKSGYVISGISTNVLKNNVKEKLGRSKNVYEVDNNITLMKVDIINKLKNKFIEKEAELEVLESELFFIKNAIDNSFEYKEVKELREKIKEIIDKINSIIEQYNLYNRSYDMSNIIGIDDNVIVDDIINYRSLLDSYGDKKKFVSEYKLLDEFKSLYSKLEVIKVDTKKLDDYNEEVIDKFDIRDKKYNHLKLKLLSVNGLDKDCLVEINKQNRYLEELMNKISVIDKEEFISKKLVGLNDLLYQGLKYIGLKLLFPLSGFIPGIALETLITRNMIKNVYNSLHYEEYKKVYYSAVDFDSELNSKISDINYTDDLIYSTINDLDKLKEEFLFIYNSNVPGYDDVLKNINIMEEKLYKNKYKVDIIKNKLKTSKKINEDKMIKVRKLNEGRS